MTLWTLIRRSLRYHARSHWGVLLGSTVGSAALLGALVVGDSVRESLRRQGLQRLGGIEVAMDASDRLFRSALAVEWEQAGTRDPALLEGRAVAAVLSLAATAALADESARANQVQVLGVDNRFGRLAGFPPLNRIPDNGVMLNESLAAQLRVARGQTILLRVRKPSALSREAIVSPQSDATVALRLQVGEVVPDTALGNFSLQRSQIPPFNTFVSLSRLQAAVGVDGRANLFLVGQPAQEAAASNRGSLPRAEDGVARWQSLLAQTWKLGDAELELAVLPGKDQLELRSPRIFLDPAAVAAGRGAVSNAQPVLTYLVNLFRAGTNRVPYSMVTAAGPPLVPAGMGEDRILVNQWLADQLRVRVEDGIELTYYLADSGARLIEATNRFEVEGVVPMTLPYADRTLMPEFPGIAQAESTHDWDAGFRLVHTIRDQDDQYWKEWRGTPKAFLTLNAGQNMWASRFGKLTALRIPLTGVPDRSAFRDAVEQALLSRLKPESIGLRFEPVRAQALAAAAQSQDFGGLFLGFSFFLVVAALILMALLFQFGLENRLREVGTLLALGFTPKQVRRLLLGEGVALAFIGGVAGVLGGAGYARLLLWGLTTLWRDAVGTSALHYHARPVTYLIGLLAAVLVSSLTIALVLRKQARRPARALLAEEAGVEQVLPQVSAGPRRWTWGLTLVGGGAALAMVAGALWQGELNPSVFFTAGGLLLLAGLGGVSLLLETLQRSRAARQLSVTAMGLRNITRQRKRSMATVALLACGTFLIVAVGANKLDASLNAAEPSSGTGGFALIGESTLPVLRDLNQSEGQEFYGLDPEEMQSVSVLSMRVREGDDASCLNLNRAQRPILVGVNPDRLDERGAFTFTKTIHGRPSEHPWALLRDRAGAEAPGDVVAAVGDANSIRWALGKKIGDTIEYTDAQGRTFKIQLAGAVANSILQGYLLIDEAAFLRRFPSESGYRMFLVNAPQDRVESVSSALSRALQDTGLEVTPAVRRLAAFNAVQNTYLNTFQILGGIGLLLGSAGLGVVVLRNVLERRGELALLQAVGFRSNRLHWMVLSEHSALLWLGLAVGAVAALLAVLPGLLRPGGDVPWATLAFTMLGVLVSGMVWTWLATWVALRGELLPALRNE